MYGAILGDMIGAPYEFDRGGKTKDFPLFVAGSQFTDDTVMTMAEAYYGAPASLAAACRARLPGELLAVLDRFDAARGLRDDLPEL